MFYLKRRMNRLNFLTEYKSKITYKFNINLMSIMIIIILLLVPYYISNNKCDIEKQCNQWPDGEKYCDYPFDECKNLWGGPFLLIFGLVLWLMTKVSSARRFLMIMQTDVALTLQEYGGLIIILIGIITSLKFSYLILFF